VYLTPSYDHVSLQCSTPDSDISMSAVPLAPSLVNIHSANLCFSSRFTVFLSQHIIYLFSHFILVVIGY